ncbi:MAG: Hsp33 family molecular chaperone HslO [bacterium]
MGSLLKSLSPSKDAVAISIAGSDLIQELWEGRVWVNPRVFLKAAQASLACLALQALNEEDSTQNIELQWLWEDSPLRALYADSLFQGAIRTSYSWIGEAHEEILELKGRCQLRRVENLFETNGIVESFGDVVKDVQDILLKSEQKDCALAVSVRWNIIEGDIPRLEITRAHAYLLHVLPPVVESQRDDLLLQWQSFLSDLSSPAEWVLSDDSEKAVREMNALLLASPNGKELFYKKPFFFCTCNQQKIEDILKLLPKEDVESFDSVVELSCKYCGKDYRVEKSKSGLA